MTAIGIWLFIILPAIVLHEAGHAIACRTAGIPVHAFGIGFGPSLKRKIGNIEYRLGLLPLGGYVMQDLDAYFKASHMRQAFIVAAGPAVNIFLMLAFAAAAGIASGAGALNGIEIVLNNCAQYIGISSAHADTLAGTLQGTAMLADTMSGANIVGWLVMSAILNFLVGAFNLIPAPGLDGGQLVVIFTEFLCRRRFSRRAHKIIGMIGLGFVVAVIALSVSLDVAWLARSI